MDLKKIVPLVWMRDLEQKLTGIPSRLQPLKNKPPGITNRKLNLSLQPLRIS